MRTDVFLLTCCTCEATSLGATCL